jgi:large subunit ribosomal protein L13
MKTYQPKGNDIKREWHLIDAKGETLGRVSTRIASLLIGKNKANFSRHIDMGDYVVVINAEKVILTGKKASQKVYRRHSGYPGGFKEVKYAKVLEEHPERIIEHAASGMIPDNRLKKGRMLRLKVVAGDKNPFADRFAVHGTEELVQEGKN